MFGLLRDVALVAIGFFGGYVLSIKLPDLYAYIVQKGKNAWKGVKGWFGK